VHNSEVGLHIEIFFSFHLILNETSLLFPQTLSGTHVKDTRQAVVGVGKDGIFTLIIILEFVATLSSLQPLLLKAVKE
jgi:hypothetical protein